MAKKQQQATAVAVQRSNGGLVDVTALLSLDDILNADDVEYKDVEMPEWKRADGTIGYVRLRTMTNDELIEYSEQIEHEDNKKQANIMLVMFSAIAADGSRLFTVKQLEVMLTKSAKPFNRLARAAVELNGNKLPDAAAAKNA
jgi:hypothetical protein